MRNTALLILIFILASMCHSDNNTSRETNRDEHQAPSTLQASQAQIINISIFAGSRITMDSIEVGEKELLSHVRARLKSIVTKESGRIIINITAEPKSRYVFYRRVVQPIQDLIDHERIRFSNEHWSKLPEELTNAENQVFNRTVPVVLYEHR